jgi:peptidoglycan-N-acetylglucosamine deacetylase
MKILSRFLTLILLLSLVSTQLSLPAKTSPHRSVCITVDDLPAGAADFMTAPDILAMTTKLVATLHDQKVPAVGFVNERKLFHIGEVDDRIKALNIWLDNGFELGNHTYSHTSLNRVTLQEWEEEVIRGETVTNILLAQHKMKMRYLRHPYLDAGRDLQTRREAEAFLTSRGYQIAPVTTDPWDWMYAGPYEDARRRNDTDLLQKLTTSFLDHANTVFEYDEKLSKELFGYEPAQIILLHGNWLEADHIGDLLDVLRKRGYQFVSLADALSDAAYSSPDEYVGGGTGWLDHWAITRGKPPQGQPDFPQWVIDRANALHHQPQPPPPSTPN